MASNDLIRHNVTERPSAEAYMQEWLSQQVGHLRHAIGALQHMAGHSSQLDLDAMPDRVKRDLGFMDGREPRYEGVLPR